MKQLQDRIHATQQQLEAFLLHGPVQLRVGLHCGAVAGTVGQDSHINYIYGETTGYYLHWLGTSAADYTSARERALMAQRWLERYLHADDFPPTRLYLDGVESDWRNEGLFCFDLAMIAGGVGRALHHGLIDRSPSLVSSLQGWLTKLVKDEQLLACLPHRAETVLPRRWSTSGGPFLSKAASRILLLSAHVTLPDENLRACSNQMQSYRSLANSIATELLHASLYALEGCLLLESPDYEELAHWFDQLIALQAADGSLPESTATPHVRRNDIVAQALRVAVFLQRALNQPGLYRQQCSKLAQVLCSQVLPEKGLAFAPDRKGQSNVWCSMFAEQALHLYSAILAEKALPFGVEDLV